MPSPPKETPFDRFRRKAAPAIWLLLFLAFGFAVLDGVSNEVYRFPKGGGIVEKKVEPRRFEFYIVISSLAVVVSFIGIATSYPRSTR